MPKGTTPGRRPGPRPVADTKIIKDAQKDITAEKKALDKLEAEVAKQKIKVAERCDHWLNKSVPQKLVCEIMELSRQMVYKIIRERLYSKPDASKSSPKKAATKTAAKGTTKAAPKKAAAKKASSKKAGKKATASTEAKSSGKVKGFGKKDAAETEEKKSRKSPRHKRRPATKKK